MLVSDAAFDTMPHFVGWPALWNLFVSEVPRVGILWFCQLSHYPLAVFRNLLEPVVKLITGRVFDIRLFET